MNERKSTEKPPRGRNARWPSQIPPPGWLDIVWRTGQRVMADRVSLVAAGVTFYFLLALFPALGAFVSLFGFFAETDRILDVLGNFSGIVPEGGLTIIERQLISLTSQNMEALSIGFVVGFLVAFWTANNGVKALFQALNIAYGETEKRSFVQVNVLAFAFTLGSMFIAALLMTFVGLIPAMLGLFNLGEMPELMIDLSRWPILLVISGAAISIIYRYGPSRNPAKWRWISWGGALATIVWLAASAGFSYYLQNFADYNATYGSLGAVIGFLLWAWLSTVILLIGAVINAEMEHQTQNDSTVGSPKPMGKRGAVMADTLGVTMKSGDDPSHDIGDQSAESTPQARRSPAAPDG